MLPTTAYGIISLIISIISAIVGGLHSIGMMEGTFSAMPVDWMGNILTYAVSGVSGVAGILLMFVKKGVKSLDSAIGHGAVTASLDLLFQHFASNPEAQALVQQLANAEANDRYSSVTPVKLKLAQTY